MSRTYLLFLNSDGFRVRVGVRVDFKACNSNHAGTLLRSVSFLVSLHSVAADPAEHALYLGGADGRIFEVSLAGLRPTPDPTAFLGVPGSGTNLGAGSGAISGSEAGEWSVMEGHARCVTCLACTTDGGHMLSGARMLPAHAYSL